MSFAIHHVPASRTCYYAVENNHLYNRASNFIIFNDKDRFVSLQPYEGMVMIGDTTTSIVGMGTAMSTVAKLDGTVKQWKLRDTLFSLNFPNNIVPARRSPKKSVFLHEMRGVF